MTETVEHPLARRLRELTERLAVFLTLHNRAIVIWAAAGFVLLFTLIGFWKWWSFGYNALDLAIYRQVAELSVGGQLFGLTIHPHSYLGDHLEFFFAALFPIYALLRHPVTLVFLQAVALAVAVFPLTKIAERYVGKPWNLLFALAYLANPVIQNMMLFEFHLLPFAIPLVSFAILAYLERKFGKFVIFSLLSMTVREDVSLVVLGFGILALIEQRSWKWSVIPMVLGGTWLVGAMKLSSFFSHYNQYKYLVYYRWLGSDFGEIIKNAVVHPWNVIRHVITLSNLGFLLAIFLPFAYLPLLKPRWLIPSLLVFIQLLLIQSPGEVLLNIHYPSLLLPFLATASAASFGHILRPPTRGLAVKLGRARGIVTVLLVVVILYSMVVIGPLVQALSPVMKSLSNTDRIRLERDFVRTLPPGGTLAGFETITDLANRQRLYSLHYVFLGKKQFSDEKYILPDDAIVALVDLRDFLIYQVLYKLQDPKNTGYNRIRTLLTERGFVLTQYLDRFAVFERNKQSSRPPLYRVGEDSTPLSTHGSLRFLSWSTPSGQLRHHKKIINNHSYTILPLDLTFAKTADDTTVYQLEIRFVENGRVRYRTLMPFAGGLLPTSEWSINQPIRSRYELLIPNRLAGRSLTVEVGVLKVDGNIDLNGSRTIVLRYSTFDTVGPPIYLGTVTRP